MKNGYFGIGIWNYMHDCNVGTLFRSAYAFGADFIFTVGRKYARQSSDTVHSIRQLPYYNYRTSDELLEGLPVGCRLVCVEIDEKARPLKDFWHPPQAVYLLGNESAGVPKKLLDKSLVVAIPSRVCLNVSSAGGIILYDRVAKRGLQ